MEYDISKEELYELYVEKEWSKKKISEHFGCSEWVINNRHEKYEITQRSHTEQMRCNSDIDISKKKLYDLYWNEKYSSAEIGEMYGCSAPTIRKKLRLENIKVRSKTEAQNTKRQKQVLSENWKGKNNPNFGVSIREQFIRDYGKERGEEKWQNFKDRQREAVKGESNPAKDPNVKAKIRRKKIERVERQNGQATPFYNPEACELIEEYGDKHGYDFQHAENGGEYYIEELGYWVDGYDSEANVVIEVDESHHFNEKGELCKRDKQRQREIENQLDCEFVRMSI